MADDEVKSSPSSLLDGSYRSVGSWYSSIEVEGDAVVMKEAGGTSHNMNFNLGDFGEADPEIIKSTGQKLYNIEFSCLVGGKNLTELGVISESGLKITTAGTMGIAVHDWMTKEEAAAMEEEGDPIEAPPGPYKVQPHNLGKFLWITGAPGLGKSTSAQLLSKTAGYVYYEADCFGSCRNPYIPPDVAEPSLAQVLQKPLKGEGIEERRAAIKNSEELFGQMMSGEDYDIEMAREFYGLMCEDINRERKRIGGNWAIAAVTLRRDLRDFIRSRLGPDLVFVVLNMEMEDVMERVRTRHKGHEGVVEMLMTINKLCEAAAEDEENAVNVLITPGMSMEDVVSKILEVVS